jgi:hemin uptake protein HemP
MSAGSNQDLPRPAAAPAPNSSSHQRNIAVIDDRIDSRDLFVGIREITIAHGADIYRLRLTAQNKLILTK